MAGGMSSTTNLLRPRSEPRSPSPRPPPLQPLPLPPPPPLVSSSNASRKWPYHHYHLPQTPRHERRKRRRRRICYCTARVMLPMQATIPVTNFLWLQQLQRWATGSRDRARACTPRYNLPMLPHLRAWWGLLWLGAVVHQGLQRLLLLLLLLPLLLEPLPCLRAFLPRARQPPALLRLPLLLLPLPLLLLLLLLGGGNGLGRRA